MHPRNESLFDHLVRCGADGNGMAAVPVRASRHDPAELTDREAATAWGD